ncbi:hypothetical protein BH11PSE7_BH11PSE7_36180 [soil metagenome]
MKALQVTLCILAMLLGLCACKGKKADGPNAAAGAPGANVAVPVERAQTDKWMGKWMGPGETYLTLEPQGNKYLITIRSNESLSTYEGRPATHRITFERFSVKESIRPGSAKEAGVAALADKSDCLVVKPGEAYCKE